MAVEPLYYDSLENLLKAARIESARDEQTIAAVYQAVKDVRLGLYNRLGTNRAQEIATYSLVDNPTSDNEILRAQGASAEAIWLMYLLAGRLPMLYMDNNATQQLYNDEPLTRDASYIANFMKSLAEQLERLLSAMADSSSVNVEQTAAFASGGNPIPSNINCLFAGRGIPSKACRTSSNSISS